jgi:hypothetical protein
MLNVVCMKWGDKYGPEYVNKLYSMVRRHLHKEYRFICLTDNAIGLCKGIETKPIPEMKLPEDIPERCWRKLTSFSSALNLTGVILYLDIDTIIVDSIDRFIDYPGDFVIIKDWRKDTGQSSVYRFNAGMYEDVLHNFQNNPYEIIKNYRNEQEYLTDYIRKKHTLTYWPKKWVSSFKYHCTQWFPFALWREPVIPRKTSIITFHGLPNPPDAYEGTKSKWYRYILPTPWIREHWQ